MPPTSTKPAALTRVSAALVEQSVATSAWVAQLPDAVLDRDSVVPARSVHDIVARLHWQLLEIPQLVQHPAALRPITLEQYVRSVRDASWQQDRSAFQTSERQSGAALAQDMAAAVDHAAETLAGTLPAVVDTQFDGVRTLDVLRVKLVDVVLATDDLNRSVPELAPTTILRPALTDAARTYAEAVGAKFPGRSIELRVPPATAVQLATSSGGPTHTRGTPPTVVETDPLTFVRLCAGRLSWADALARHLVTASGAHADLRDVFPLFPAAGASPTDAAASDAARAE